MKKKMTYAQATYKRDAWARLTIGGAVIAAVAAAILSLTSCSTHKYGCKSTWETSGYNPKYKR